MQSNDDLQSFFGLIASTVERSQLEKQIQSQKSPCLDQSSSEEEDRGPSSSSKSSSSRTKELESLKKSSEWMFTGHSYFQNMHWAGALPDVEVKQVDEFEEMWETIGDQVCVFDNAAYNSRIHCACHVNHQAENVVAICNS